MTVTRRALVPLVAASMATLALVVPGSVGATGKPTVVGPVGASGATGSAGAAEILTASVTSCHADPLQANRSAIFAAQMTSIPGTRTIAVNVALLERAAGTASFAAVNAPGFGVWVSSQPGVGVYTYEHEVTALPAPAAFRVFVRARWIDRHHRVIRREQLLSPVCTQPLQTPNLAVGALRRAAGAQAGTVAYNLSVANLGAAAAGPFQVSLTVNGVALANASLPSLAPGASQVVQFTGPPCTAGSTLTAVADPTGAVTEPANPARTRTFPCAR